MALDAGSVFAVLGGKFNPAGFAQFDAAMKTSVRSSTAAERAHRASTSAVTTYGNAAKVAAVGGIAAVGVAIFASVKAAGTFEKQMSQLKAVTNASAGEMKLMSKAAQELGTKTGIGATAAGQAMTELAKGGISAKDSVSALKGTIALAQAGGMDLATAGETVANALNLFALKGTDATKVADSFANAANSTTADVSFFAQGLAQGGAAAKAAGLTFDQTTVALEAMAANGFKSGSDAGTSLKTSLIQMARPTKQAQAEMEKLNLSFFDAHGTIKPLTTISQDLQRAFSGLTKEEKLAAATRIAGTDGMRTLLALADQGPAKLNAFAQANAETGTAAKVAAEQMNNFQGNVQKLKAQAEQLGISLGTALLPYLTKAVGGITAFVGALRGTDQSATALRTLLVSIAGFSVVTLLGPKLLAFGQAISAISMAARTAPSFAAFAGDIALIANPVGLAAVGLGILAGAIYLVASREDAETAAARRFTEAKNKQLDAITQLDQAERDIVSAKQASQSADADLEASTKRLNDLRAAGKQGTQEYSAALTQQTTNQIAAGNAAANQAGSEKQRLEVSNKLLADAKTNVDNLSRAKVLANTGKFDATDVEALYNATRLLTAAQDRVSISSANVQRLQAGIPQVLGANVAGYATLIRTVKGMPKEVRTRYTLAAAGTAAKIGEIVTQLRGVVSKKETRLILRGAESAGSALIAFKAIQRGVPISKVVSITTNSNSKKEEVSRLKEAIKQVPAKPSRINFDSNVAQQRSGVRKLQTDIDNLHGKTITIETIHKSTNAKASGTSAGTAQTALVGEGGGPEWIVDRSTGKARKVTGAQMANLNENEYVIPTESKYRPQALGLLSMLAADLGVAGFKKGKLAKPIQVGRPKGQTLTSTTGRGKNKVSRYIPERVFAAHDLSWFDTEISKREAIKDQKKDRKLTAKALKARKEIADLKQQQSSAKSYLAQINRLQTDADIDRDLMTAADNRDDQGAYNDAFGHRKTTLGSLQAKLKTAYDLAVKYAPGSTWTQSLRQQLAALGVSLSEMPANPETITPNPAAETTYTADEQTALDNAANAVALAQLNTPSDITDDRTAVGGQIAVLQAAFNAASNAGGKGRGGITAVTQIANDLRGAQEQLAGLVATTPTITADQQAQADQVARQQTMAAQSAAIDRLVGATLGGSPTLVFQSYVPPSPTEARRLADYTVGGIGYQGATQSSKDTVGI